VVAAGLSLVYVIMRLSRPGLGLLARDPATGAWGRDDRRPDWQAPAGVRVQVAPTLDAAVGRAG
jgi:hypothetical protein